MDIETRDNLQVKARGLLSTARALAQHDHTRPALDRLLDAVELIIELIERKA